MDFNLSNDSFQNEVEKFGLDGLARVREARLGKERDPTPATTSPFRADVELIGQFADSLFRYADPGTFVSLRAFYDDRSERYKINTHELTDNSDGLAKAAVTLANEAAQQKRPVVFCPPISTFRGWNATEQNLANGLALSVECDQEPSKARIKLESLLGPATVVVASGGEWSDPETGEIQDKLHLHWRLSEPTRTADEHSQLKLARALAAGLVGGDASNKPIVHPIRWPGSWHRKNKPRLAKIETRTEHELDLSEAVERLREAVEASRADSGPNPAAIASTGSGSAPTGEERETSELIRDILTAADFHAPLAALAMRFLKRGLADGATVETLRGIMLAIPADLRDGKNGSHQPGRWQARYDDIPRAVRTARAKLKPAPEPIPDSLSDLVNPATLQGIEPPEREWIVDNWLPVGTVTSLYGRGGIGKTLLAQQLQTAVSLGRPFLGIPTQACRSVAFYCEDDGDELHRRQVAICRNYAVPMNALGDMRWQARAGKSNVMATVENGLLKPSDFYEFIRKSIEQHRPRLIILDNIAQLFGGNENVRPEVTQFVNAIGAIAIEYSAAVLLLGHTGKASDSEYSGSTAWDATVRSRWLFERPAAKAGEDADEVAELADLRVLRRPKANYAGSSSEIAMRWVAGSFHVEGAASFQEAINTAEVTAANNADDRSFLECLDALAKQGRHMSASKQAQNYAGELMLGRPEMAGASRKRIIAAMERLFQAGEIEVGRFGRGRDRHSVSGIVRKAGAGGRGEARDGRGTVDPERGEVPGNPLKTLSGTVAGKRGEVPDNPLKSEREGRGGTVTLDTTYLKGTPPGEVPFERSDEAKPGRAPPRFPSDRRPL